MGPFCDSQKAAGGRKNANILQNPANPYSGHNRHTDRLMCAPSVEYFICGHKQALLYCRYFTWCDRTKVSEARTEELDTEAEELRLRGEGV